MKMVIEIPILRGGVADLYSSPLTYISATGALDVRKRKQRGIPFREKIFQQKILSRKKIRAFSKSLREFQELISFVNFMRNRWKIMVFSHGAKSRELQKKIWEVKKSEINSKKSGHHNTSISAHLEHPSTYQTISRTLTTSLPPLSGWFSQYPYSYIYSYIKICPECEYPDNEKNPRFASKMKIVKNL